MHIASIPAGALGYAKISPGFAILMSALGKLIVAVMMLFHKEGDLLQEGKGIDQDKWILLN
jgi:hypothetical protein